VGFYRRVDKSAVKSFSVLDGGAPSSAANPCANYGNLATTITAPVAGKVVVNAVTSTYIGHVNPFNAGLDFSGNVPNRVHHVCNPPRIPGALLGRLHLSGRCHVAFRRGGRSTTTFYFNSQAFLGGGAVATVSAAALLR
jgi:hypothetical protein